VEAPNVRRNWLAKAALATVALSVPMAGVAAGAQAATQPGSAQPNAATPNSHGPLRKPLKKPKSHRSTKAKKKAHNPHYRGRHRSFNEDVASLVKAYEGVPYLYGGTSPAGFDCSGLTQYVYRHLGKTIQRTAEDQFLSFRPISKAKAWGGDLVFFHVDSNPNSYVYHVGIYEGGDDMVAETTTGSDAQWQDFSWAGDTVTFGTLTH
jgi:cell wall-associated NlpC family hydrolase